MFQIVMYTNDSKNIYVVDESDIYNHYSLLNAHNVSYIKSIDKFVDIINKNESRLDAIIFEIMNNDGNIITDKILQARYLARKKGLDITVIAYTNCSQELMEKALVKGVDFAI